MTTRPEVVSLLFDFDPDTSSPLDCRFVHADGRPFTQEETSLAASATVEEMREAQQLNAMSEEYHRSMAADHARVLEILRTYLADADPKTPIGRLMPLIPEPERTELELLFDQLAPDGFRFGNP